MYGGHCAQKAQRLETAGKVIMEVYLKENQYPIFDICVKFVLQDAYKKMVRI
jgi:hypothetical protein